MKIKRERLLGAIIPAVSVVAVFVLWEAVALSVNNGYVLPTVGETFKEFFKLFTYGEFYAALAGTLLRSFIAFIFSFLLAFGAAYLSYRYKNAKRAISPLIAIIRALPTIAVVLLLAVWTTSNVAPVIVTSLVVLPTLYTNAYSAFSSVDKDLLEMCRLYGVKKKEVFFKVSFPSVAPAVISSVGAGLSLNLKLMVAAEVLSQTAVSMGYLLNTSKIYFETATMIALVIISVIIGLTVELVFDFISKKVGKWQ